MKKLLVLVFCSLSALFGTTGVRAQQPPTVASSCGGQSLTPGAGSRTYVDTAGDTCVFAITNDPCSYAAKSSVKIAITSATTTAMVAVSGTTTVYVCGYDFTISEVVTTANTLKFESGTGSACASPVADLTGLYGAGGVTAAAPIHVASAGNGSSTVFNGGASNGVCAVTAIGATAFFEGVLTYVQQ